MSLDSDWRGGLEGRTSAPCNYPVPSGREGTDKKSQEAGPGIGYMHTSPPTIQCPTSYPTPVQFIQASRSRNWPGNQKILNASTIS
ncbi:hypothetical protein BPOR_0072g00140 [Botrytis porri]|uniref:Uncharacterized protein n=1 Tax=Botrytis porri TaxID=87229 RepID=A0A4Z1L0K8_9HELO|nr:hypothetical protein BPOR_0072g00140 [Botrytis porri]